MMKITEHFKESFFLFVANHLPRLWIFERYKSHVLRYAGFKLGKNVVIWGKINLRPIGSSKNVIIDDDTFINADLTIECSSTFIKIGKRVLIGPNVLLVTSNHGLNLKSRQLISSKPIIIENDVWIGAGSIILPGITIKKGSVIAAGSVVSKNIDENIVVGGVPAKKIKNIVNE